MTQHIDAKPTVYRGIQFRSRLEARWAIFLDFCPSVLEWQYESTEFKFKKTNWKYTPDFWIHSSGPHTEFHVEVKPTTMESKAYADLKKAANDLRTRGHNLILAYGDFYRGVPRIDDFRFNTFKLKDSAYFPKPNKAILVASGYRFDI